MTISIAQVILLLATVGLVAYFVASRRKACVETSVKLGLAVFIIACLRTIVYLDNLTIVANWTSATWGTDLLFYVLVLASMFTAVSFYIRFREQELHYARLAHAVALKTTVRPEEEIMVSGSQNSSQKDSSTNVEKNAPSD